MHLLYMQLKSPVNMNIYVYTVNIDIHTCMCVYIYIYVYEGRGGRERGTGRERERAHALKCSSYCMTWKNESLPERSSHALRGQTDVLTFIIPLQYIEYWGIWAYSNIPKTRFFLLKEDYTPISSGWEQGTGVFWPFFS